MKVQNRAAVVIPPPCVLSLHILRPAGYAFVLILFFGRGRGRGGRAINNIQDPNSLYVGQVLSIPAGTADNNYYVARPGDTLWSIAQRFNTTVKQLSDLNRLNNPNVIYPGQIITIG